MEVLNLHYYSKTFDFSNQLVKEFQHGVHLPDQLPINLIPPSIRSRTAVSRVSSSGNSLVSFLLIIIFFFLFKKVSKNRLLKILLYGFTLLFYI